MEEGERVIEEELDLAVGVLEMAADLLQRWEWEKAVEEAKYGYQLARKLAWKARKMAKNEPPFDAR